MTAPDLKPCPFCGGIAYLRDDVSHSTAYFIGCATEDCFGEIHWEQTEAEAVTAWNTRATLAALDVPEVQALVEAAREMSDAFYSNGNVTDRHLRACKAGVKLDAAIAALRGNGGDT